MLPCSRALADQLAYETAKAAYEIAGGVGDAPVPPENPVDLDQLALQDAADAEGATKAAGCCLLM